MIKEQFYKLWTTGRGLYVLLGLLIFGIFISPILIAEGFIPILFIESIFTLMLIAGIFATPCNLPLRLLLVVLAFTAIVTSSLDKFGMKDFAIVGSDKILGAITLIAFSILIVKHFLMDKVLLRYRIVAAIAIYLIIGVLWARFYELVYLFDPKAFTFNEQANPFTLVYFSFVTLMTIGYGDILPLSVAARSLAIFEGVVGQLYIVILISSLVSEFSTLALQESQKKPDETLKVR